MKGASCLLKQHGSFMVPISKAKCCLNNGEDFQEAEGQQTDTAEAEFWTKPKTLLPKTATRCSSKEQGQKLEASSNTDIHASLISAEGGWQSAQDNLTPAPLKSGRMIHSRNTLFLQVPSHCLTRPHLPTPPPRRRI